MNVEYQLTGRRRDNIPMRGTEAIPREGESVIFIFNDTGEEEEWVVSHVIHIVDEEEIKVQVVLK